MAKTFKARFQQLIAPLSAWTTGDKKDFKILPGEIAFATASTTDVKGGEAPVVLFKVNNTDAEATWGKLEFSVYAKAQDVYAWAKAAGITVEDKGTGTVISKIKWEDDILIVERRGLTNDDLAGLTIGNALHANAAGQVDHSFTVIGKEFDGSATQSVTAQEVYDAIKDLVAADDNNDNTTYSLSGANDKIILTPSEGDADEIEVAGAGIASVSVSDNKITVEVSKVASETEAGLLSALDKAKINKLAVNDDGTIGGTIEEAARVSNEFTVFGKSFDGSAEQTVQYSDIEAQVKASARAELANDISTAEQNAKAYTDDMKDAILGEGIKDTFDTLVEIQTWIEGAGVNATELSEAIAEEARLRGEADTALGKRIDGINNHSHTFDETELNKIAEGDVAKWNGEIGAKALADELSTSKLDANTYKAYVDAHKDDYTNPEIVNLIKAVQDDVDAIHVPEYTLVGAESGFVEAGGNTIAYSVELKKDGTRVGGVVTHEMVATGTYDRMNNPLALKDYVDNAITSHNHKIENLEQVEYVIFNANF